MPAKVGFSLRKLRNGRIQLLVPDPDRPGKYKGLGSYADRDAARAAGQEAAAEQYKGTWLDPTRGDIRLSDYLADWLAQKRQTGRHGDRYTDEAARLVRLHIDPTLGDRYLSDLRPATVSRWYDGLVAKRLGETGVVGLVPAKSYRLLSAALSQAVTDELIPRSPCTLKGAGVEHSPERPLLTVEQITAIADAMPDCYHALVLVAGWCGLRFGELAGLQRRDIDLKDRVIRVATVFAQSDRGAPRRKEPKTEAGRRPVAVPKPLVPVLEDHLDRFAEPGPEGLVFVGPRGGMLRRQNWATVWSTACTKAGVDGATLHDLRHAAGTMAAQAGATARELQRRLGHATPAAAHRYQHAAELRDKEVAKKLGKMMPKVSRKPSRKRPPESP